MEAFGARTRGGLASLLSVALIVSGALLAAPAANAEEGTPAGENAVAEAPAAEAPATEAPAAEAPVEAAPAEEAPAAEAPATDAPAAEAPTEAAPVSPEETEAASAGAPEATLRATSAPALTVTEAPRVGGEITVSGSGFNPAYPGIYIGIGPSGLRGFYYAGAGSLIETVHVATTNVDGTSGSGRTAKMNDDGTFSLTFSVPAFAEGSTYSLYTSKAHGQGMADTSQNVMQEIAYAAAPVVAPSVEVVGSVTDLDPEASNVVTVKGSGFLPDAPGTSGTRPPLAGKFAGTYVVFGSFADAWRPSTGAPSSTRAALSQKWAVPAESMAGIGGAGSGAIELTAEGTFEATLTLSPDESKAVAGGSWGIATYSGSGAKYAAFETFTPVTFAAPSGAPVVRATSSVSSDGLKVDVSATGLPGNIYAALIERGTAADLAMDNADSYAAFAQPFPTVTDGAANFTLIAPAAKLDSKKEYEVLIWKIHSAPNVQTIYGQADVEISTTQWEQLAGVKPPAEVPAVTPAPQAPGAGSLTWGISSGFANYVTGNIAKGTIATNGVGGGRGGYVFPQATGSVWNAATHTGTVSYSGSVTFIGHGGLLSETYANPVITVSSPLAGTISAGGQTFTLNLAGGGFSANADGSVSWSNVPVGGAISGGNGGGAGGAFGMDSLSFTVGSASGMNFGSTTTTSTFAQKRTAAATPPATTGLTVATQAAKLVAGGEIEITAGGFQPNEQGILVVIYSEPTVLDTNAKADENGVVRWIGQLPKELSGKHTITLQGSINVGQEITIAAADAVKKATKVKKSEVSTTAMEEVQAASALPGDGAPAWIWWTSALALLLIAGTSTGLVVAQRRKNDANARL